MATENRRAPRLARRQTNMADAVAAIRSAAAGNGAAALLDFRIHGGLPFGVSPLEAAQMLTEQAHALLTIMSAAYEDADDAQTALAHCAFTAARGAIHAQALAGLGSLIALSAFFIDEHRGAQ